MDRSIAWLHEGRVQKILSRLRAKKVEIPEAFVLANYKNTAAYGKFSEHAETNRILRLYKESTMNQAPKAPPTTVEALAAALAQAEADLAKAKREHIEISTGARHAAEHLTSTAVRADAVRNALGKAKMTEAIALIDKVGAEAPAGSEAAKDIDALAQCLMQRNVHRFFGSMPFESIFARPASKYDTWTARTSSTTANVAQEPAAQSKTAAAIASMTTLVGAGQPRQAKPSPVQYKVGDKVVCARPEVLHMGKVCEVRAVGNGMLYVEWPSGSVEWHAENKFDPATDTKPAASCTFPGCLCPKGQTSTNCAK